MRAKALEPTPHPFPPPLPASGKRSPNDIRTQKPRLDFATVWLTATTFVGVCNERCFRLIADD